MADSPFDAFGPVSRRRAQMSSGGSAYPDPGYVPADTDASVAPSAQNTPLLADEEVDQEEQQRQLAQQQRQDALDQKAQQAAQTKSATVDQANWQDQANADAANAKQAGIVTQRQTIPGPDGKNLNVQAYTQNPDGTTAYKPGELPPQTLDDGKTYRVQRDQWGRQVYSDAYSGANANLKVAPTDDDGYGGGITSTSKVKGLPAQDVTDDGVTTGGTMKDAKGNVIKDAQGNPLPDIQVSPDAPINDPRVQAGINQDEQKLVAGRDGKTGAAGQRVNDTLKSDLDDATQAKVDAESDYKDAQAALSSAKNELDPQTSTMGNWTLAKAQAAVDAARANAAQKEAAMTASRRDWAMKTSAYNKAKVDPLSFLQSQSDAQSQATEQANGNLPTPSGTQPSPSGSPQPTSVPSWPSSLPAEWQSMTGAQLGAVTPAPDQRDAWAQAMSLKAQQEAQGQGGQPGAIPSIPASSAQAQPGASGTTDNSDPNSLTGLILGTYGQPPPGGASAISGGTSPTPSDAGVLNLNPDGSLTPAEPVATDGLLTGKYGDKPDAPATMEVAPNDGAPPGQKLVAYKSLISGQLIDPNSFTGGVVEFARRVDNDLDTSVLGAVGGTVRLASAFGQSKISPAAIAERTIDGLIGTHTAQDQQDFAKKLGVAADTIDKASKVAALPVSSTNDNSPLGKSAQWTSLGLQSMLGGEGQIARALQSGGYAVQMGEAARQNALDQGATEAAADQAGITTGAEMALANYVFGPFSKLLAKVPGISSASPTLAKAALNTVMGFGLKGAKGAAEFGLINTGSEAANQIALEQSSVANPDAGTKIAKAGLDGIAQGAIIQGSMEGVERGSLEYNNMKVGQGLKAEGGKAAIVVQTAHAFQGIDAAQQAGKLTPQQAQAARAAVVSPFTPDNQAVLVAHATNTSDAQGAALDVMKNAAKEVGTPVPGFENQSNSDVHQAAAKTAGVPAPDADLQHLNDDQLAAEHDEVAQTVQQHQAAQNPEPATIRLPDGREVDNPNWTGKAPFDPGVRRMGKPDATPEYQQKVASEIDRRQQANQAVAEFASGPRPDGDGGDLHDEINRRMRSQQVSEQAKVQLTAISNKLAQQTKATEDLAQRPAGIATLRELNKYNAGLPPGTPKADATTARAATELAPPLPSGDSAPIAPHYFPIAHQIERLGNPDQQEFATAAMKLNNGRTLSSDDQKALFGDQSIGQDAPQDARTGEPLTEQGPGGKPILTKAGLSRLKELVPVSKGILPDAHQDQLDAQAKQAATTKKPVGSENKAGKLQPGTGAPDTTTPPPFAGDISKPDTELAHLDDETLGVARDNIVHAQTAAKAHGGNLPAGAQARLARLNAELARRQAARAAQGAPGAIGAPAGHQVDDSITFTHPGPDGRPVQMRGDVTEVRPTFYRVATDDGAELKVPIAHRTEPVKPAFTGDAQTIGKAAQEYKAIEEFRAGRADEALTSTRLRNLGLSDDAIQKRLKPGASEGAQKPGQSDKSELGTKSQNPRLVSAIEASMGGRRMELTDNLRKQKLSSYTDSSAANMTVQDGIDKGYLEEFQEGGKTFVRPAKSGGGKGEAPGPKVKAADLPGIVVSTIKPEQTAAASLLGSVYTKFRATAKALGVTGFKTAAHSEGTIGLAIRPDDLTKVELDLPRLAKELAKLPTPVARQTRLEEVMDEELRHIALEKVAGEDNGSHSIDKADETFARLWASASDIQRKTAIDLYDKGALAFVDPAGAAKNPNAKLKNSSDANKGREYLRMLSQLQARGRTSEIADLLTPETKTFFQKVVDYLRHVFAKVNDPATQQLLDRTEQLLRIRPTNGEEEEPSGSPADIALPNGDTIPAKYEVAELGNIQPSHRNGSPNPAYPPGLNERDYSLPAEKAKNEGMVSSFDPRRVITDNPDAVNGPPIVDKSGIVLGGNRRTIMLSDPRAYAKYKPYLQANAARFGINPDDVAKMQQPVLIRRVDTSEQQRPELIRRLNETPTGGIDTANDAVSAGKQITPDLVKSVSDLFQQDIDKTPLQHLSDGDTKAIAQGLLDAGAIRPNDKEKYVAANGNLTPEGARYARNVLLGGILPDANLLREVADTPTGTKLLNGLSAVYLMKARGVDIAPLQEGVALEADRQRLGIKNVVEHQAQGNLSGIGKEPTIAGKTMQSLLGAIKGNEARRAFTQLQSLVAPLEPGQTALFGEVNRKSIADVSDGEVNQVIKSSKRIVKAADSLKKADPVGGAPVNYSGPLHMPGMPEGVLSPEQREVEARFAQRVQQDPDRAAREYAALPDSEGGRVIDMDEARRIDPTYNASKANRTRLSVATQAVVRSLAVQKLLPEAGARLREGDTMGLTAGGPGSGKGAIKHILGPEWYGAKFVYDGVLRHTDFANALIADAAARGAKTRIWYVHVPVEKAVAQAVDRAENDGRSLPIDVLATGHWEAQNTIRALLRQHAGNPNVDIAVVDNTGPRGTAQRVQDPLAFLEKDGTLYRDADEVKARARQALEANIQWLSDPAAREIFRTGSYTPSAGKLSQPAERRGERGLRDGDQAGSASSPVGGAGVNDVPHALSADEVANITDDWNRSPFANTHESNVRNVYRSLKRLQDQGKPLNADQQRLFNSAHDRLGITDDGRDILGGARVQDTGTGNLFARPETPVENQTRPDETPLSRAEALRIYNQLSPRRQAGEDLNAGQAQLLERAEQALGQTFIPGLDETASTRTGTKAPPPQVNFGKPETGIRAELRTEGPDMFGARPPGQQSLFGSGVRNLPLDLPGQRDFDIADEGATQRPGGTLPRRVAGPLRKYVKALHQADLDLKVPGQRPLDFARQYQTDFGTAPDSALAAAAREIQKDEGIAMTPKDLFESNLDLADGIANRFDNIPSIDPEDRRQVARLKLYQVAESFDPAGGVPFRSRAIRAVQNAMIDLRRKQMRLAVEQPTLDEPHLGSTTTSKKESLAGHEPLAFHGLARNDSRAELHSEVSKLPDKVRQVMEGILAGKSHVQIAQEQGYSKQYAGGLAKAGLTKLRLAFEAKGLGKSDLVGGAPIDNERVKAYLDRNGVQDRQASETIRTALAQSDLPGFDRPYTGVAPRSRAVRKVPSEADQIARAQVLRNPADSAGLKKAFATGDTISSILPNYIGGRIPAFDLRGKTVDSPSDFAKLAWSVRSPYVESLKVAVLNGRNRIVHSEVLNVGTLNEALTDTPGLIRSIQQAAGKTASRRVIISHNHPSGDPTPSDADVKSTRNMEAALKQAGIDLVDHAITNGKRFSSSRGGWNVQDLPDGGPSAWEAVPREDLVRIDSDKDLAPIVRALRQAGPDHTHIVYLNTKLGITAIERSPAGQTYDALLHRVSNGVAREGAAGVLLATNDLDPRRAKDMQRDLSGVAKMYDVSSTDHASYFGKGLLNETPDRPALGAAAVAGLPDTAVPAARDKAGKMWAEKGVQSPFFKCWFGDFEKDPAHASKIVDAQGKPQPVFHHGQPNIHSFDIDRLRPADTGPAGFYFSPDKEAFSGFHKGATYQAYLDIRNPVRPDTMATAGDIRYIMGRLGQPAKEWVDRLRGAAHNKQTAKENLRDLQGAPEIYETKTPFGVIKMDNRKWRAENEATVAKSDSILGWRKMPDEQPTGVKLLDLLYNGYVGRGEMLYRGEGVYGSGEVHQIDESQPGKDLSDKRQVRLNARQVLMEMGFDGVDKRNLGYGDNFGDANEVVAFHPEQIKSATDNRGTFNPNDPRIVAGAGVRPPLNFNLEGQSVADAKDAFDKDDVDTWPVTEEERERLRQYSGDLDDNEQHSAASTLVDDMRENGWPDELVAKAEQLRDAMEERHQAGKDELNQRGDEAEEYLNNPDRQTAHDTDLDDTDTWPEHLKDQWDDLSLSDPETWPAGLEADARRDGALTETPVDENEPEGDKDTEIDQDYAQAWMADHLVAPEVHRAMRSLPDGPDIEEQRRSSLLDTMAENESKTRLLTSPENQALEQASNDQNDFARGLADKRGIKSAAFPYVSEGKLRAHEQGKGWTDHELTPEELAYNNTLRQGFSDAWRNHRQAVERDMPAIRTHMEANPPARWDDSRVADWKRDNSPEGGEDSIPPTQGTLFGAGLREPPTDTNRSPRDGFAQEHYREPDPALERHALAELPSAERARARIGENFLGIPVHDAINKVVRGAVDKIPLDSDVQKMAELLHNARDQALMYLAPQVRTDSARLAGELYSHRAAEYRLMRSQAIEAVKKARAYIDSKGKNALDFTLSLADAIENNTLHPDPEARPIVDLFRSVNNRFRDMVRSLPNTHFRNYIVDYFPHMFADRDQAGARKFYLRKIEGSRSFTKQRTIPTIAEAVEAGFHLKSDNAADLYLMKWDDMLRYKMGQDYLADLKEYGGALPFDSDAAAPMGWSMIDPRIGKSTVSVPADRDTPGAYEVRNDQDALPGMKPEKKYAMDKAIHYYAPDSVAQVLNNHLAPGLSDHAWYKGSMMLANSLNQANLGFSAFHLGFVTCDSMISKQADAMESLIRDRDPVAAAKKLAQAYTPGVAPVIAYLSGDKLMRAALAPGTARHSELNDMIDAVVKGGGDFKRGEIYSNGWIQAFKQQWQKGTALGYAQAGIRSPLALIEAASHPILGHIVPRVKLGVFMDMARRELRRLGPDASHEDTLRVLQKAWASVDNRLGEFAYDNLHLHQGAKHVAFLAIRSVGWDLGTARELGMGTLDGMKMAKNIATGRGSADEFSHRLAYTLSLPMMLGAYGALATYLATGKGPQDLRDYFFPPTGELDQNGHKMRFAPPTYGKDVAGFLHQPGQTMVNKLNPIWSNLFSIWQNKDFWGNQIYGPDDPLYKKGISALGYEASAFEPFALSGFEQNRKQGASAARSIAPFFGLTPAASWIDKSPAELRAEELMTRIRAGDVHTSEEAAKSQAYLQLRSQIAKAGTDGRAIQQAIQDGISNGVVTPPQVPSLVKEARMQPLERSAASLQKNYEMKGEPVQGYTLLRSVFDKGTTQEQTMILPYLLSLWSKALRSGVPMSEMGPQPVVKGAPKADAGDEVTMAR